MNLSHRDLMGAVGGPEECEISIAAINAAVKRLVKHKKIKTSQIAIRTVASGEKVYAGIDQIEDMDGNPFGHRIVAEIERRSRQRKAATLDLGEKSLRPCVCLKVKLQVITKNGLPAEDPKADPKFRVQFRYWNGRTHTLWADYTPRCEYFTVKIKKKPVQLHFDNHEAVLKTIEELMP